MASNASSTAGEPVEAAEPAAPESSEVAEGEAAEAAAAASLPVDPSLWQSTSDFEAKQGDVACQGGQELSESALRGSLYSSAAESSAVEDAEAGAPAVRAQKGQRPATKPLDYSKWDGLQSSGDEESASDVSTTSSPAKVTRKAPRGQQAGAGARVPVVGSVVTMQQLERSRKFNGESGKVVEDLGHGFYCVELRGGKRIKVRPANMAPAHPAA
eukprot:CAMPEP_0177729338 /NCGR_PEP_ID=MMETSP0484_2-20121128/21374_1 /TAXON_ID=354590 /ORGANISM="Rhodomonas lens, Strain RHODO" /LENGTH=213 /DNA_ID=CAMNT_0019242197 /DNA_START=154 /DNA_END=791 /DNA_ORIENTATION=+